MGVRKLACRSPWTIDRFDVEQKTGDILGIYQSTGFGTGKKYIPTRKSVYYRTTTINGDPSGRSILRNAYTSYQYLNNMQSIEAVGVEQGWLASLLLVFLLSTCRLMLLRVRCFP